LRKNKIIFVNLTISVKTINCNYAFYNPIFSIKNEIQMSKTIGAILRELREAKGLLLREVGANISLDPTLLSKIEQDKRMPTRAQVKSLTDFYKDQKEEILIAWLSDKLYYEVLDEDHALRAMKVAEEKIKYNRKD
jgi:HTH-type transcriptional regulator, competence development regulator